MSASAPFTGSFLIREAFHLFFLRSLSETLTGRSYAVKGGICLRFFSHSPRLSEDLDLDIAQISVDTLKTKIRNILNHRAFRERLQNYGVTGLRITEPKQTETTQRWKIQLMMAGGHFLSTRIECSRRQKNLLGVESGIPTAEVLKQNQMVPFVCRYYGAEAMLHQKLEALASSSRNACRDLFDLHHLLTYVKEVPGKLPPAEGEKIQSFRFRDFQEQVAPFLPTDLGNYYDEEKNFEKLKQEVIAFLKLS